MIYPGIRSEIGSAVRTAHDRLTAVMSLDAQVAAFMSSLAGPKALYDPSRSSSRFQDAAGSALVTADGQPFARLNDSSGAGNHIGQSVAASMPVYRTDGVLHWAQADGQDDSWYSLSNFDCSATDRFTIIVGARKESDALQSVVYELGASAVSVDRTFGLLAPRNSTGADISPLSRGTTTAQTTAARAAPSTFVATIVHQISGPSALQLRLDGVTVASSATSQGTGNFSSAPLNIFRRNNASQPFNGRLYGLLVIGRLLTVDERTLCERWMASKTGVTL